jgi:cellulose synthase (UDP-forming)
MVLTIAVYLYYLAYRLLYTINWDAPTFSLVFYYAEFHGCLSLFLYFFQMWHPLQRTPPPAPPGLRVDVYIPTYKEDVGLVRKTVFGCINMAYPHKTYILDDGNRPEFSALAAELGCAYLARKERAHAKAGNLNHALSISDGNFIVVFDADYVPQPDFLDKTLGYFTDEKVAFVQTPQNYYNVESFSFRFKFEKREKWNEGDMFYRLMMPARDYWNAAFFAGTSAVFRKRALDEIGGFATETITEDLHTSVRLYKAGWKGVYHNELLSSGLAATDLKNYHIQKLRWAEGNISLLFADNPLWTKGLTLPQRICFFATVFGWFIGLPKLIYFTAPAIMLLTGWYPIFPFERPFMWRYAIFLAVVIVSIKIVSRGQGRIRDDEIYNMMNFFVLSKAVVKALLRLKARFIVTAKGAGEAVSLPALLPQLTIILLCVTAIEWGALKWAYGVSHNRLGLGIGMFWSGVNGYLACLVVATVTASLHRRKESRFLGGLPVWYEAAEGKRLANGLGTATDLNEDGMALTTFSALPVGEQVGLRLYLGSRVMTCNGAVLYINRSTAMEGVFRYGVKFTDLSREDKDAITAFCFSRMLPAFMHRFDVRPSSLTRFVLAYYDRRQIKRRTKRMAIGLPMILRGDPPRYTVTEDVSLGGLAFMVGSPMATGTHASITLVTPFGRLDAEIEIRNCRGVAVGRSYRVGATFAEPLGPSRKILTQLCETGR